MMRQDSPPPDRALQSRRPLGMVGVLDQIVASGTNFAIGIFLARFGSEEVYGGYMVAFSILLMLTGIQNAMVYEPMTFIYPSLGRLAAPKYATGQLLIHGILSVGGVLASGITVLVMHYRLPGSPVMKATLGMLIALVFVQSRDFLRRILYARFHVKTALLSSLLYAVTGIIILSGLLLTDRLTATSAFLALGAGGLAASAFGVASLHHTFCPRFTRRTARRVFRMNWTFARWGILGLSGQYAFHVGTFMTAAMLGPAGAAELHAARNLLTPVELMMTGLTNAIAPRASALRVQGGGHLLNAYLYRTGIPACGAAVLYAAAVFLFAEPLLDLIYGGKYGTAVPVVRLWCLVYFLYAVRRFPIIGLGANRRPHIPVLAGLLGGAGALIAYQPAISNLGTSGAVLARVGAEFLILLMVVVFYRTRTSSSR